MGNTKLFLVVISATLVLRQSFALDPNRKQSINTVLEAKWALTPFALEISEFLSDTKDEYFWAYLEYLAEDDIVNRKMNDKEFYQNLLGFTSRYVNHYTIMVSKGTDYLRPIHALSFYIALFITSF